MAISFVSAASNNSTSVTLGTHAPGDLIVITAIDISSAGTLPSLGSGYATHASNSGSTCPYRMGWKIAESSSETSGTWTNADSVICHVYRGASGLGDVASLSGSFTNPDVPALTLEGQRSWVAGFGGALTTSLTWSPTGMSVRTNINATNNDCAGFDTNGQVSSFTGLTDIGSGIGGSWRGVVVEILERPTNLFFF